MEGNMNYRWDEEKMNYQEEKALAKEMEGNVNYRWDEEKMNYQEDFEALRHGGFTREEYQRLAFVRWLVATGRLSDHIA
jgi:hypothetical protein